MDIHECGNASSGIVLIQPVGEDDTEYIEKEIDVKYEKKLEMTFIGYHTEIRPEEGYQKVLNSGTRSLLQNMQDSGRLCYEVVWCRPGEGV